MPPVSRQNGTGDISRAIDECPICCSGRRVACDGAQRQRGLANLQLALHGLHIGGCHSPRTLLKSVGRSIILAAWVGIEIQHDRRYDRMRSRR